MPYKCYNKNDKTIRWNEIWIKDAEYLLWMAQLNEEVNDSTEQKIADANYTPFISQLNNE